jgi:hypothetical protein
VLDGQQKYPSPQTNARYELNTATTLFPLSPIRTKRRETTPERSNPHFRSNHRLDHAGSLHDRTNLPPPDANDFSSLGRLTGFA